MISPRTTIAVCLLLLVTSLLLVFGSGCSSQQATQAAAASTPSTIQDDLAAFQKKADTIAQTAVSDLDSPAGQQLIAAATSTALNVGADVATGQDASAVLAGLEGAATALNAASGLPHVTSTTLGKAAADGSGVLTVASQVAPAAESIIKTLTGKGVNAYAAAQAVVKGLFAVRSLTATTAAMSSHHPGTLTAWVVQPVRRQKH